MPKKFYTVREASKIIGVSTNTIYKYLDGGSLKGKRLSGHGRFKIPYSEVAPYLTQDSPVETANNIDDVIGDTVAPKIVTKENKTSFFGPLLETTSTGLGALLILWVIGSVAMGAESTLMKDVGGAAVSYSGRTFSGFGNLISSLTPSKSPDKQEVAGVEVSKPQAEAVKKEASPDLNAKFQDTERLTYELYANAQTFSASTQKLLGKSRTLTTSELNDAVVSMSELLGSTITGQINNLTDNWNFPSLNFVKRSEDQLSSLLDRLSAGSLGAFTKPDIKDLNDLVAQAELLQRLVGNITDTTADATVFGNLRKAQALAKAVDSKNNEIDKILSDWSIYDISEKEYSVKTILNDTLSINMLPRIDEIVPASPSGQLGDAGLKNVLLTARGVLDANKIHLSQKAAEPVTVIWIESDGAIKTLSVNVNSLNPVAVTSKQNSVLAGIVKPTPTPVATPTEVLGTKVEIQESVISLPTPIPLVKATPLPVTKTTPVPEVAAVAPALVKTALPSPTPYHTGFVAAASVSVPTSNTDTQKIIGAGISFLAFVILVFYLLTLFVRVEKKPKEGISNVVLPVKKTTLTILTFPVKIVLLIAAGLKKLTQIVLQIPVSVFRFFIRVLLFIKKLALSLISGLLRIVVAVIMFPVKIVRAVVAAVVAIFRKIWSLITDVISLIIKTLVSIKNFIFSIPGRVLTFILKIISLVKNFFISLATGLGKLINSIITSFKRTIVKIIRSIVSFISNIISAVKAFFGSIVSAITKVVLFIKNGILEIIFAVKEFFVGIFNLLKNLFLSIVAGMFGAANSTERAITRFINGTMSLIVKTAVGIKMGIIGMLNAVKNFFLSVINSVVKFIVAVAVSVRNGILTVARAVAKFVVATALAVENYILKIINSVITFVEKILLAVARATTLVISSFVKGLVIITTFFLKAVLITSKTLASIVGGFYKVLVAVRDGTDSTLGRIHFEPPELPSSRVHYRKTAVFILVATSSTLISSIFAIRVLAQIGKGPATSFGVEETIINDVVAESSLDLPKEEQITILETGTGWLRVRVLRGGVKSEEYIQGKYTPYLTKKTGGY